MPPRAPSQVHVETLIARGRLVLAVFMLLALRVAMPRGPWSAFSLALAFLGYAAVLALLVRTRFGDGPRWPGATHAVDLTGYGVWLFLLGGLAPPMLAWFLFLLVSATFDGAGAARSPPARSPSHCTSRFGALAAETLPHARMAPAEFITLALLMGVMTVFVGLVGAYEDWRGGQLARLAAWAGPDPDRPLGAARRDAGADLAGARSAAHAAGVGGSRGALHRVRVVVRRQGGALPRSAGHLRRRRRRTRARQRVLLPRSRRALAGHVPAIGRRGW